MHAASALCAQVVRHSQWASFQAACSLLFSFLANCVTAFEDEECCWTLLLARRVLFACTNSSRILIWLLPAVAPCLGANAHRAIIKNVRFVMNISFWFQATLRAERCHCDECFNCDRRGRKTAQIILFLHENFVNFMLRAEAVTMLLPLLPFMANEMMLERAKWGESANECECDCAMRIRNVSRHQETTVYRHSNAVEAYCSHKSFLSWTQSPRRE